MWLCLQLKLGSHFAQPNSIEFQPAVSWRHQQKVFADLKAQLRQTHAEQLKSIMLEYREVRLLQCAHGCKDHHLHDELLLVGQRVHACYCWEGQ